MYIWFLWLEVTEEALIATDEPNAEVSLATEVAKTAEPAETSEKVQTITFGNGSIQGNYTLNNLSIFSKLSLLNTKPR